MKTSMIQLAALALALGISAKPMHHPKNMTSIGMPTGGAHPTRVAVLATGGATSAKASKTKTPKAGTPKTKTKTKTKKGKTSAGGGTDPTDAPSPDPTGGDSPAPADPTAAPTGEPAADPTGSSSKKSSKTKSSPADATGTKSGAPATTKPATGGGGGGAPAPGGLPASSGTSVLKAAQTIAAGQSFDGKMMMIDRGVKCTGQAEGGDSDAVFILEKGASISNVIIGPNQVEGIHCMGGCTLTNVWWSAVCEDAFTVKTQAAGETTNIKGGGAFGAKDKVVQHNGGGTINMSGFTADNFGKLYRSCGNCKTMFERHIIMDGINASNGKMLAGVNSNFGDTAKITNTKAKGVKEICTTFKGTTNNSEEPTKIGTGADGKSCIFGSDVVSS